MKLSVPEYIESIDPYKPGKPLDELEREYGISDSIKLASNENPLGPSPKAVEAIRAGLDTLHRYPDSHGFDLVAKLSEKLSVNPENIVLGNGSDDIIAMLTRTMLKPGDEAILPRPSFLMYEISVRSVGAMPVFVPLDDKLAIDLDELLRRVSSRTRMTFLCNPNNPTGTVFSENQFRAFLKSLPPEVIVVIDEAYIEFVRDRDCASGINYLDSDRTVVTLRTFSKAYGLAGLRIGYGVMEEALSGYIHRVRQPFNTSSLAQAAAIAALDDQAFLQETQQLVHEGLIYLFKSLDRLGFRYFPTQSNFFLIDVKKNADDVFELMLREGVIIRSMTSYGYPKYIRINVGLPGENERFIQAFEKVMSGK